MLWSLRNDYHGQRASQTRSAINVVRLTAPSPGIVTFTATPSEIMEDSTSGAVLSWKTGSGAVTLSTRTAGFRHYGRRHGSVTVKPDATTTYISAPPVRTEPLQGRSDGIRKQEPEILL
ncbi:MAG: hypothetical protein ACLT8E_05490 [Akkermansia sp.]